VGFVRPKPYGWGSGHKVALYTKTNTQTYIYIYIYTSSCIYRYNHCRPTELLTTLMISKYTVTNLVPPCAILRAHSPTLFSMVWELLGSAYIAFNLELSCPNSCALFCVPKAGGPPEAAHPPMGGRSLLESNVCARMLEVKCNINGTAELSCLRWGYKKVSPTPLCPPRRAQHAQSTHGARSQHTHSTHMAHCK
jgi:hypothetical protein